LEYALACLTAICARDSFKDETRAHVYVVYHLSEKVPHHAIFGYVLSNLQWMYDKKHPSVAEMREQKEKMIMVEAMTAMDEMIQNQLKNVSSETVEGETHNSPQAIISREVYDNECSKCPGRLQDCENYILAREQYETHSSRFADKGVVSRLSDEDDGNIVFH